MSIYLPFDIETVKNEKADTYYELYWQPPKNIKNPELIAARRAEAVKKAALRWWTGKVICISYKHDGKIDSIHGDNELEILRRFADVLYSSMAKPIGKNSRNFDCPFLVGRYSSLNIGVPAGLNPKLNKHEDVNDFISFSKSSGQVPDLMELAWGLDLDEKLGSGDQVHDWYFNDDGPQWDKIVPYCEQDVRIVATAIERYRNYVPSGGFEYASF